MFIALSANVMAGPGVGKNPGTDTIYDIASTNGNFTVLTSLLDATGLNTALDGKGQFTVFAPTDAAFTNLIASENGANLAHLLANNHNKLLLDSIHRSHH